MVWFVCKVSLHYTWMFPCVQVFFLRSFILFDIFPRRRRTPKYGDVSIEWHNLTDHTKRSLVWVQQSPSTDHTKRFLVPHVLQHSRRLQKKTSGLSYVVYSHRLHKEILGLSYAIPGLSFAICSHRLHKQILGLVMQSTTTDPIKRLLVFMLNQISKWPSC